MGKFGWRGWVDVGLFGAFITASWIGFFPNTARRVLAHIGVEVR